MKLDLRLTRSDKTLLAVSLAMICMGGLSLGSRHFSKGTLPDSSHLGEITGLTLEAVNDVRRKSPASLAWEDLTDQSPVFSKDSIYSGADSSLQIQILNGSLLRVEPNTLLSIEKSNGQLILEFKLGAFQIDLKAADSLTVKFGGSQTTLQVSNGRSFFHMQKISETEAALFLKSGQAQVLAQQGPRPLKPAEQILLDTKKNSSDVLPAEIRLKQPLSGETIHSKLQSPLLLEWENPSQQPVQVWVSRKRDLSDPVFQGSTTESSIPVPELSSGWYYWKVSADSGRRAALGSFQIRKDLPPTLIFPPDGAVLREARVLLIWSHAVPSEKFLVEVSKDPQFQQSPVLLRTRNLETKLHDLKEGRYFWRVRADRAQTATTASTPSSFLIKEHLTLAPASTTTTSTTTSTTAAPSTATSTTSTTSSTTTMTTTTSTSSTTTSPLPSGAQLTAPTLTAPPDGTKIVPEDDQQVSVLFNWSSVEQSAEYTIQFSFTPDFRKIAGQRNVKTNSYALKSKINSPTLYWRVRAFNPDQDGEWSSAHSLLIEKTPE